MHEFHYYNENDRFAAAWLRELAAHGHIGRGVVDERSICDIKAAHIAGARQFHAFAGIGGWPYALRLAGWPEDRPVWTGSCPCQPFSTAGKRRGTADERHLWPIWRGLIAECRPPTIFGEQVASKDGRLWLAGVRADLEALGYAVGAADLCSAGVGAPCIRQRLWWVAVVPEQGRGALLGAGEADGRAEVEPDGHGDAGGVGRREVVGRLWRAHDEDEGRRQRPLGYPSKVSRLGDGHSQRRERGSAASERLLGRKPPAAGPWRDFDLVWCRDERWRRLEPGLEPLVAGLPGRVGLLRGYGNSINPWVAAEFVGAVMDVLRPGQSHHD